MVSIQVDFKYIVSQKKKNKEAEGGGGGEGGRG